jgi:hypothetical protein
MKESQGRLLNHALRNMIIDSYIDNYIGEWKNERGNCLNIKRVDDKTALVSFFAALGGSRSTVLGAGANPPWT